MLFLFKVLARWPLWLMHGLGAGLGWLTYAVSPSYRKRLVTHATWAGVSKRQTRGAIAEAGRMLMELPYLWLRPPESSILTKVQWRGADLLEAAHANQQGVVILTPHMGCFEIAAQAIAERYLNQQRHITVLYRPARKPWLRDLVGTARTRPGLYAAPANLVGVRQLLRAVRDGQMAGLLPDQVPPEGMGVWAPFFGRPAYTMTLAARLAHQPGAALLLLWCERLPWGRGYVIHVSKPTEPMPGPQAPQAESAAFINRCMERLILQCPQQYLWGYNRYKSGRDTEPSSVSVTKD
jgi:Kdo2-lipid IVA lauroyltransferase/acyltransferase